MLLLAFPHESSLGGERQHKKKGIKIKWAGISAETGRGNKFGPCVQKSVDWHRMEASMQK